MIYARRRHGARHGDCQTKKGDTSLVQLACVAELYLQGTFSSASIESQLLLFGRCSLQNKYFPHSSLAPCVLCMLSCPSKVVLVHHRLSRVHSSQLALYIRTFAGFMYGGGNNNNNRVSGNFIFFLTRFLKKLSFSLRSSSMRAGAPTTE
jgi:hypothetical protein